MTTTIDASKIVGYAVLEASAAQAAKIVGYAVLISTTITSSLLGVGDLVVTAIPIQPGVALLSGDGNLQSIAAEVLAGGATLGGGGGGGRISTGAESLSAGTSTLRGEGFLTSQSLTVVHPKFNTAVTVIT